LDYGAPIVALDAFILPNKKRKKVTPDFIRGYPSKKSDGRAHDTTVKAERDFRTEGAAIKLRFSFLPFP
jgi:predicted secreted protein